MKTKFRSALAMSLMVLFTAIPLSLDSRAQGAPGSAPATESLQASGSAPVAVAPASAPPAPQKSLTLLELFRLGGWTMWPLLFCSAAVVGLTIYNLYALRASSLLQPVAMNYAVGQLEKFEISEAMSGLRAAPGLSTNILAAGLERVGGVIDVKAIESGMEEGAGEEVNFYARTINYLSVIGVITPMIGLLGTVSGMIKAFRSMAVGGMGRPELLADNISEALITTAAGLIVGIPSMVLYFFFKYRFAAIAAVATKQCGFALHRLRSAVRSYDASANASQVVSAG
jgi:biopolymer transport protein ExbB